HCAEECKTVLRQATARIARRTRRFARQMFELIALPQMVERGGCALVMALAHRIAALVDFALELLGALPGGLDGPIRISADGKAALTSLRAIVEHKGL